MSKLPDLLLFDKQLSEEELAIQKTARDYCDNSLMPRIQKANRDEVFDKEIYKELLEMDERIYLVIGTTKIKTMQEIINNII